MQSPLIFAVSLAAFAATSANLVRAAGAAGALELAASLERGAVAEPERLQRLLGDRRFGDAGDSCADANSRARLTLAMAGLRAADATQDISNKRAKLRAAIVAARTRLGCSPLDGNAWLQWATLKMREEGPTKPVIVGLQRSALVAPSEAWILLPRLDAELGLIVAGAAGLEPQYARDLKQYVDYEASAAVAAAFVGHGEGVRGRMRPLIDGQPEGRRRAIVSEIGRLGLDYSRS